MPDTLFGWGGGQRLAESDQQEMLLRSLAAQHTAGQIAMQPAQARTATANAGLTESQAQSAQLDLANRQALAKRMQERSAGAPAGAVAANPAAAGGNAPPTAGALASGAPVSAAAPIEQLATDLMETGNFKDGMAAATKAATIRKDEAAQRASQATQKTRELEAGRMRTDVLARVMDGVTDTQGLHAALQTYQALTGDKAPFDIATVQYSPELVSHVKQWALTTKEKADIAQHQANQTTLDAERRAVIDERKARAPLLRAETELAQTRTAALKKHDGAGGVIPEKDMKAGTDVVLSAYQDMDPAEARMRGREIAERAKAVIANNPAIGYTAAQRQAFDEMKAAGQFQSYQKALPKGSAGRETEAERKAAVNYITMKNAEEALDKLEAKGVNKLSNLATYQTDANGEIHAVTKAGIRRSLNPDEQVMFQAARQFAEGAGHLKSGARINNNTLQIMTDLYIPLAGESKEVIARKKEARLNDIEAGRVGGGRSVEKYEKEQKAKLEAASGAPSGVAADVWAHMTPDEKKLFK